MKPVRGLLLIACVLVLSVFAFNVSFVSAAPTNTYCGSWDGASVSANNLWKQVGDYQYYLGFGFAGDEHSCIGVWDTISNAWISSSFCKYGDLRDCHVPSALSSNAYAYRYPSCPAGQQNNGDGCSPGCTSPNYLDNGFCSPYLTPMIYAQGSNANIGWSFPSTTLSVFMDAFIYIANPFGATSGTISVLADHLADSQSFTLPPSAATGLYQISSFSDYSDDRQHGSAYELLSKISSFVVVPKTILPPPTCISFTYSSFSSCANGQQSRTVLTSSPTGCTGGTPTLSQTCQGNNGNTCQNNNQCLSNYCSPSNTCQNPPAPTCSSFTYNPFNACSFGSQARAVASQSPTGCTGGTPTLTQTCTGSLGNNCNSDSQCSSGLVCTNNICSNPLPAPTCTLFTYSPWISCRYGQQNRTVLTSSPSGCVGGSTLTIQSCLGNNNDLCNANSQCLSNYCAPGNTCQNNPTPAPTCAYFTYNNWNACANGQQSRSIATQFPSGCTGGSPALTQTCTGGNGDGCTLTSQCNAGLVCNNNICTDVTPPAAITGLTVSAITNTSALLSWTNPTDSDFSHVVIYVNNVNLASSAGTSFALNGLTPSTRYNVSVYTVDTSGNINLSAVNVTFTTLNANQTPDTTPPAAITGLYLSSLGQTYFGFGWVNPTDPDFYQVIIYVNGANVANTSSNSFAMYSLTPSTTYLVSFYTQDTSGNINSSAVSYSVTTLSSSSSGGDTGSSTHAVVRSTVNPSPSRTQPAVNSTGTEQIFLQAPKQKQTIDFSVILLISLAIFVVLIIIMILLALGKRRQRPRQKPLNTLQNRNIQN